MDRNEIEIFIVTEVKVLKFWFLGMAVFSEDEEEPVEPVDYSHILQVNFVILLSTFFLKK